MKSGTSAKGLSALLNAYESQIANGKKLTAFYFIKGKQKMRFNEKAVLITGASSGIGRATALAFAPRRCIAHADGCQ
jgi:NADPH:quinone reductase-like Zn-dependent oxidoreductase